MKKLWVVLIMTLLGIIGAVNASAATGNERRWFFMDEQFESLSAGVLAQDITIDGLTISKGNNIFKGSKRIRNILFKRWIITADYGSKNQGYVKFYVNGNTNIHILAGLNNERGDGDSKILTVYSEANNKYSNINIQEINEYVYEYRGNAGYIYLYTPQKYIRIFGIAAKDYVADEYASLGENEKDEWDFASYRNLYSNVTSNIDLDGMKLNATETYNMELGGSAYNKSYYGVGAYGYLNLKGTGQYNSRFISFSVPQNSDIYVTARSGDGVSERALIVRNTYFGVPDTDLEKYSEYSDYLEDTCLMVSGDIDTYKISYYGDGEDFVLSSADSGIRIYRITIVPRVNKVVESKVWDISNNSKFTTGAYADAVIDGLTINNARIEQCNVSGYTKRIHIKGDPYDSAGKAKFNISDSSGSRGSNVKRTISVTANTDSVGIMLVLVNSEGYLVGCADLSTEIKEYAFDYTGTYDEISVYTYYPENSLSGNSYIYKLNNGIAGTTGPDDTARTISVTKGQKYQYYFTAENVSPDKYTYKITYNPAALTVKYAGYGDGSNNYSKDGLNIIKNDTGAGEIIYTIDKDYEKWSGVTVSVIFEAKSTGNTTINYIAEIN